MSLRNKYSARVNAHVKYNVVQKDVTVKEEKLPAKPGKKKAALRGSTNNNAIIAKEWVWREITQRKKRRVSVIVAEEKDTWRETA